MTSDDLWTEVWDNDASVPYIYNGNRWVSYDDHRSVAIKVMTPLTSVNGQEIKIMLEVQ